MYKSNKEKAIVIDIDGVILDSYAILKEMHDLKLHGDDMWNYFHAHCNEPRVVFMRSIMPFLSSLRAHVRVILSTARNEKCRQSTENRLHEENFPFDKLYMRNKDDYRPSSEVKSDHLDDIMKEFEVIMFIDDDLSNCEMAAKKEIFSLRKV